MEREAARMAAVQNRGSTCALKDGPLTRNHLRTLILTRAMPAAALTEKRMREGVSLESNEGLGCSIVPEHKI